MIWWRRLVKRGRLERELENELADHLERQTRQYMDGGMSEADARRRAALTFGAREAVKEACRDARGTRWVEDAIRDARYALRSLRKQPVSAVAATLCLALAIGATTAIFGLVDAVMLEPLPVPDPHRLVLLGERAPNREVFSWSVTQFRSFAQSPMLSGICAFRPRTDFSVAGGAEAQVAAGQLLSGGCFKTLGVRPALGRLFDEEDDRLGDARPVAVISYRFWIRQFGSSADVIGRSLDVRGHAVTIVGVTPAGFDGLEPGRTVDVSLPLSLQALVWQGGLLTSPRARWLRVMGRLSPGITRDRAAAELEARWTQFGGLSPAMPATSRFVLLDGAQGLNDLRAQFSAALGLVFAAVALLLLLACANLASLVLARTRSREHELALRLALGAGRGRVARQLFTEALALALLAGGAGLLFATWGSRTIVTLLSRGRTPILIDVGLDARVVVFALAVSVVTSVLFGMWPALKASRANLQPDLQAGARTMTRGPALRSHALIGAQTVLSIVLVVAAVLFARSLTKLYRADLGMDKRQVVIAGIGFGMAGARNTGPLIDDLSARLADAAGIRSVTQMMDLPFRGTSYRAGASVPGRPESADDQVGYNFVGPRFFETMGIPLLEGRDFRADDDARSQPVAVISRSLAVRFFAGRAVGEHLQLYGAAAPVEIVGVAKDVPYEGVRADRELVLYRPQRQAPMGGATFAIRADLPRSAVVDVVRRALHDVAPSVPIVSIMTLQDLFDGSIATERMLTDIAAFFGVMALLLVAIGIYGTLASALAERTREFGIRLALGATEADIVRMIVSGTLLPVVCGVAAGLPLAFAGTRVARSALFGITPRDPATYLVSAGVVLLIAAAAAMLPALAAIRANPISALRQN